MLFCVDEIGEGDMLSITDEARLTLGVRERREGGGGEGCDGDGVPETCTDRAVDSVDGLVVCCRFAP